MVAGGSRGIVRRRTRSPTPETATREVVREESGTAKKVQVVERDTMETKQRLRKRDKKIFDLSAVVRK